MRRITAVSLAVSLVAMATSGLMMFVIERPSFTIQMNPVHKFFGPVLIVAAITHLTLNFCGLTRHLKTRATIVFGAALVVLLVVLYGLALTNRVPAELAEQMDVAAARAEHEK